MDKFYNISSQHENAEALISHCVHQLYTAPATYNFGFIYATDSLTDDFPELLKQCKATTGIEHWIGTIGLGVIANNQELYDKPAVSIMLANFLNGEFTMVPSITQTTEISAKLHWPHDFVTNFGILHGDPLNEEIQNIIEDIQQQIENGFLVGGLASSRNKHYQVSDDIVHGGISGVLFSEKIEVITNLSQGCRPVGDKHVISKSIENTVFTLDDKPALELLMYDMGIDNYQELENQAGEIYVGLCIKDSDRRDYTVRNLVGIDIKHSLFAINDYLTDGNELVFCKRTEQTAIDDMQHMLENLAKRLNSIAGKQTIKGGIYVSCLGRGREQFSNDSEEIKMIHDALGDFPLTGFFANGEIHHNKLYGYTGVLTLFI